VPPLPSPRVAGAAVLLMLGFGIAIGAAAGPHANATLASATPQRRVVVVVRRPAPVPAATPTQAASKPERKLKPVVASPSEDSSNPASAPASSTPTSASDGGSEQQSSGSNEHDDASDRNGRTGSSDEEDKQPTIKHVWIVALTGHTMDEALASPSPMPYLSGTLRPKGLLLSKYKAVASGALANLIALISGRKPTADQQAGCAAYGDVDPKTRSGCVFAKDIDTLPGQLTAVGRTWRGYVEDSDAAQAPDTCRHPAPGGPLEPVMARDPFLFFHAIVDTPDCAANVAGISRLAPDAQDADSAPTLALVIPNACHDGADQPCAPGAPAGLGAADAWVQAQLDPLLGSKAYKADGMVVVTFDAGPDPAKPVGALLISSAVKAGDTDDAAHDHFALLRTIEDLFSLDPLREAKDPEPIEITNASR
jgi:hypothetical protein